MEDGIVSTVAEGGETGMGTSGFATESATNPKLKSKKPGCLAFRLHLSCTAREQRAEWNEVAP